MLRTTPALSLLMVTPRAAVTLPTASSSEPQTAAVATSVATATGGGPAASAILPALMSEEICANFTPARTAMITRQIPAAMRNRLKFESRLPPGSWDSSEIDASGGDTMGVPLMARSVCHGFSAAPPLEEGGHAGGHVPAGRPREPRTTLVRARWWFLRPGRERAAG